MLPEVGIGGQRRLKTSSVAVIGAGGLGSPACLYLSASGIGTLRIIDGDTVAVSNLHRQVIHDLRKVGINKAISAEEECRKRNDTVAIEAVASFVTKENVLDLLRGSDVVVDATDNAQTRYLLNDACVTLGLPLVSGSALRWEGQLTVYNSQTPRGPCYRCIFPDPPAVNNATSCDMQGVMGPAPGIIGVMQASEALKICLGLTDTVLVKRMLILDCLNPTRMWRNVELRGPQEGCAACGHSPSVSLLDFEWFCPNEVYPSLPGDQMIQSAEFFRRALQLDDGSDKTRTRTQEAARPPNDVNSRELTLAVRPHDEKGDCSSIVLDVRPEHHFLATHIQGSLNVPVARLLVEVQNLENECRTMVDPCKSIEVWLRGLGVTKPKTTVYCLCRRGRDGSKATKAFNRVLQMASALKITPPFDDLRCLNVQGGLLALKDTIPQLNDFPVI